MNAIEIIQSFNQSINDRDLKSLGILMTEDHTFIDSANNKIEGKVPCLKAWSGFFTAFPDYKNHFEQFSENRENVIIIGYSTCSNAMLSGPAIWTVKVIENKISEWRVYEDNEQNREALGLG